MKSKTAIALMTEAMYHQRAAERLEAKIGLAEQAEAEES